MIVKEGLLVQIYVGEINSVENWKLYQYENSMEMQIIGNKSEKIPALIAIFQTKIKARQAKTTSAQ